LRHLNARPIGETLISRLKNPILKLRHSANRTEENGDESQAPATHLCATKSLQILESRTVGKQSAPPNWVGPRARFDREAPVCLQNKTDSRSDGAAQKTELQFTWVHLRMDNNVGRMRFPPKRPSQRPVSLQDRSW
jgi:hypothetical protein